MIKTIQYGIVGGWDRSITNWSSWYGNFWKRYLHGMGTNRQIAYNFVLNQIKHKLFKKTSRKWRCKPPKMSSKSESCITKCWELTFDLLWNARSGLIGRECLRLHDTFHFDLWDCLTLNLESCPKILCQNTLF